MSWLLLKRFVAHQAIWGGAPPPPVGNLFVWGAGDYLVWGAGDNLYWGA